MYFSFALIFFTVLLFSAFEVFNHKFWSEKWSLPTKGSTLFAFKTTSIEKSDILNLGWVLTTFYFVCVFFFFVILTNVYYKLLQMCIQDLARLMWCVFYCSYPKMGIREWCFNPWSVSVHLKKEKKKEKRTHTELKDHCKGARHNVKSNRISL